MRSLLVRRPRLSVLAAMAALAMPVAGCGSDDASTTRAAAGGDVDPAVSVPASVPVYGEGVVRPDGDLRTSIESIVTKFGVTDPGGQIVAALDKELEGDGASYATDIEPWLGRRVGVGLTSVRKGTDPDFVVSVAVTDTDAAEKVVEKTSKGDEVRQYAGTSYHFDKDDKSAVALLGDTLVVGTEPGLKAAVDARKGAALADDARFTRARDVAGEDDAAGFFYVDPSKIFDLVAASGRVPAAPLGMVRSALTGSGLQSVAGSLRVDGDSLLLDAASSGATGPTAAGDAAGAAAAAPAGAFLALGVGDIDATIDQSLTSLAKAGGLNGMSPDVIQQQLNALAGFDVQQELLSWMGDATLWLRGTSLKGINGALVVRSNDPAKSKVAPALIEQLLTRLGLAPRGIADGLAVDVPGTGTISIVARGDRFAVVFGDAVDAALDPGTTIGDTDAFRTAAATLDGTQPQLFVDTPVVVDLLKHAAGSDDGFKQALPYLEKLGPMAAGSKVDGDVRRAQFGIAVP